MAKPVYFDGGFIRLSCGHLTFRQADIDKLLEEGFDCEISCLECLNKGATSTLLERWKNLRKMWGIDDG